LELAEDSPTESALVKLEPYLRPEKAQEARLVLARIVSKSHSGPIPSAEELEHLEKVLPGSANRCFEMAEREQGYRHGVMERIVEREFSLRGRGQYLALAAMLLLLTVVGFLGYLGDTQAAAWLGSATIVGVVTVFATGKLIESKEDVTAEAAEVVAAAQSKAPVDQKRIGSASKSKQKRRR
jgi:uncharacterized membrane protein